MAYQLVENDFDSCDDDPASIRAARNPNSLILISVLNEGLRLKELEVEHHGSLELALIDQNYSANSYVSGALHCLYNSPLVAAIEARLPQNIAILFVAGANPNGIQLQDMDEYSVRFIRGRNPAYNKRNFSQCPLRAKVMAKLLGKDTVPQTAPLTAEELDARRKVFSRFWSEHDLPTLQFRSTPARTALEIAASIGDVQLFDQVRDAGPDESWWVLDPTPHQLPDTLTHSALSTSSPCHEAIISRKNNMLEHLFALGYSPNILPLAAPTWCFSPTMTAIASCNPPNIEGYDILAQNVKTNLNLRTPIFSIHVLHLATARLDIPLLQHLIDNPNTPLQAAGTTALGHTLLHIATLPLTDAHANIFSRKIFNSIHDVRTIDAKSWFPINFVLYNPARRSIFTTYKPSFPFARTEEDDDDSRRQEEMTLWLLRTGTQDVGAQDVYGNTPLHYLAAAMYVNHELLEKVMACQEGGETVWKSSRNELGYTPEELLEDGKQAEVEQWKAFWVDADSPIYDVYSGGF